MAVVVPALVETGIVAEVCGCPIGGDGPLGGSCHRGCVVAGCVDGAVADIVLVCHEGGLSLDACLLEVAVGDVSLWVVHGD